MPLEEYFHAIAAEVFDDTLRILGATKVQVEPFCIRYEERDWFRDEIFKPYALPYC